VHADEPSNAELLERIERLDSEATGLLARRERNTEELAGLPEPQVNRRSRNYPEARGA